jgi:hypothetical protein
MVIGKRHHGIDKRDAVAGLERRRTLDPGAVEQDPVDAAKILDQPLSLDPGNPAMLPRDSLIVEMNVRGAEPADDVAHRFQDFLPAGKSTFDKDELHLFLPVPELDEMVK